MNTYRDLIVWQKSVDMVTILYKWLQGLPKNEEYGLLSQMKRSAVSVASNIAEGYGRGSQKDYVRFLRIARGSLYELETQIEIVLRLKFKSLEESRLVMNLMNEIEKMLNSMIVKIDK